jgi:hypothetical protein
MYKVTNKALQTFSDLQKHVWENLELEPWTHHCGKTRHNLCGHCCGQSIKAELNLENYKDWPAWVLLKP